MHLSVVILAAGQGKRMNSDLPKVLQPLAGQPLLQHVIDTARNLRPTNIYVVYGHGGAQVQAALAHEHIEWILQADQLGTGHAVMQAMCVIPDDHAVLVLYGDVPLIRAACLKKLVDVHNSTMKVLRSIPPSSRYRHRVSDERGSWSSSVWHIDNVPTFFYYCILFDAIMMSHAFPQQYGAQSGN